MIKKYSGKTNREIGDIFGGMHYSSVNRAKERLEKKMQLEIKAEIDKTDKEIDQMVYELYELTPEEIKIVEEGV